MSEKEDYSFQRKLLKAWPMNCHFLATDVCQAPWHTGQPCRSKVFMRAAQSPEREAFDALLARYREIRRASARLCEPLSAGDYELQAMPEVSPPKWHLAHTTWFFETFLLKPWLPGYQPFN